MNIESYSGAAEDIMHLISQVLLTDESGKDGLPTGIVIEMPDGSIEPITYAWYDRQRDMIRLTFDCETEGQK